MIKLAYLFLGFRCGADQISFLCFACFVTNFYHLSLCIFSSVDELCDALLDHAHFLWGQFADYKNALWSLKWGERKMVGNILHIPQEFFFVCLVNNSLDHQEIGIIIFKPTAADISLETREHFWTWDFPRLSGFSTHRDKLVNQWNASDGQMNCSNFYRCNSLH